MHYVKLAVKISLILALICFLFPFVTVSCEGESKSYKGIEFMTGIEMGIDEDEGPYMNKSDNPVNYWLIGAFVLGFVGMILGFTDDNGDKMIPIAILSALGLAALTAFRMTFVGFYELEDYADYIDIDYKIGWIGAVVMFVIAFGGAVILISYIGVKKAEFARQERADLARAAAGPGPLKPGMIRCPKCGTEMDMESRFCFNCGAPAKRDCPFCGAEIPVDAEFCTNCGKNITTGMPRQ